MSCIGCIDCKRPQRFDPAHPLLPVPTSRRHPFMILSCHSCMEFIKWAVLFHWKIGTFGNNRSLAEKGLPGVSRQYPLATYPLFRYIHVTFGLGGLRRSDSMI